MKPNIVRVECIRGQNQQTLSAWVAYLDRKFRPSEAFTEVDYVYCFRATDELSAYKEAQEYLDSWSK